MQGALVAAGALAVIPGAKLLESSAAHLPPGLRRSDYTPYLRGRFDLIDSDGSRLRTRLVGIDDLPGRAGTRLARAEDAFILRFRTSGGDMGSGQGVMRVLLPAGGSVRLLLSPTGPAAGGTLEYAAVINRRTPPGGKRSV